MQDERGDVVGEEVRCRMREGEVGEGVRCRMREGEVQDEGG